MLSYLRKKFKKGKEQGNTFVALMVMLPLLLGIFGVALDAGVGYYTRIGLQNSLDNAAVAGASQMNSVGVSGGSRNVINATKAAQVAKQVYSQSRQNYPNIQCGSNTCYTFTSTVKNDPTRGQYLQLTIKESSKSLFLQFFGIEKQNYTLVSDARIGFVREQ